MKRLKENKMKTKYFTIIICIFLLTCVSARVSAIDISNCGILGFAGETYTMTANASIDETTCFTITAADVTLDCNGFFIIVNNALNINGVYSNQSNTTVKNCNMPVPTQDNSINNSNDIDSPKKALFDIISEIVSEPKKSGEDLIIKVSLINFGASNTIDANLKYTISDSKGETTKQYTKIVPVTTQVEYLDHINTTGMMKGKYTLKIDLIYVGQTFPASTEKVFYVGSLNMGLIKGLFRDASVKTFLLSAVTMVLLIGVYRKSRMNKSKEGSDNNTNNNYKV